ncbi:MAG: hypothetical protein RRB13_12370 [bacterium]|nr:hypothetical protein [bacterium]
MDTNQNNQRSFAEIVQNAVSNSSLLIAQANEIARKAAFVVQKTFSQEQIQLLLLWVNDAQKILNDPEFRTRIALNLKMSEQVSEADLEKVFSCFSKAEREIIDTIPYEDIHQSLIEEVDRLGDDFNRGTVKQVIAQKLNSAQNMINMDISGNAAQSLATLSSELKTGSRVQVILALVLFFLGIFSSDIKEAAETGQNKARIYAIYAINALIEIEAEDASGDSVGDEVESKLGKE